MCHPQKKPRLDGLTHILSIETLRVASFVLPVLYIKLPVILIGWNEILIRHITYKTCVGTLFKIGLLLMKIWKVYDVREEWAEWLLPLQGTHSNYISKFPTFSLSDRKFSLYQLRDLWPLHTQNWFGRLIQLQKKIRKIWHQNSNIKISFTLTLL